jgi:Ca2+-binding EF-hand superfamily protein
MRRRWGRAKIILTVALAWAAASQARAADDFLRFKPKPKPVTPEIISQAEIAAQRLMDKLDVNLDGYVDMSDAEAVVARGIGPAETLAVQGAMRYDLDGDGKITPEEVKTFARRVFDLLADPETGRIPGRDEDFDTYLQHELDQFNLWDRNHDGIVTREEIAAFIASEDPRRTAAVRDEYRSYIEMMDKDHDGRISLDEMTAAFVTAATFPERGADPTPVPSLGRGLPIAQFVSIQATEILREFGAGPGEFVTRDQAVQKGGQNCYLLSMDQEGDGTITRAKIERRARAAATIADVDKDGMLSRSELMDAWAMLHGMKTWQLPDGAPADRADAGHDRTSP